MQGGVIDATPDEVDILLDLGRAAETHVAVAMAASMFGLHGMGPYHRADLRAAVYGNRYDTSGYRQVSVEPA